MWGAQRLLAEISPSLSPSFIPFHRTQAFPDASNSATASPSPFPPEASAHYAASDEEDEDVLSIAWRTAHDIITRATPLKIMLMPTSVPIAQAELDGH